MEIVVLGIVGALDLVFGVAILVSVGSMPDPAPTLIRLAAALPRRIRPSFGATLAYATVLAALQLAPAVVVLSDSSTLLVRLIGLAYFVAFAAFLRYLVRRLVS